MFKSYSYLSLAILFLINGSAYASKTNFNDKKHIDLYELMENQENDGTNNLGNENNINVLPYDMDILALSSNGKVFVGQSFDYNTNGSTAFRYNTDDGTITYLGTFHPDNEGWSIANAVSDDGRVVVGEAASDISGQNSRAFRHNEGDFTLTDLGTLNDDNSGSSRANAVSADGRVVAGNSTVGNSEVQDMHVFRHNDGDQNMTDLGTLNDDNSGFSDYRDMSSDGRVIVGISQKNNDDNLTFNSRAFRHNEGDEKMTDLGTLRADNSGSSEALAVSADGRVVVGYAQSDYDNDNHSRRAFRHNEGDEKMTDLGTLRADNSGSSEAYAVSGDGSIIVGAAESDNGRWQAFRHNDGDENMTALYGLKEGNMGFSEATAISKDGLVIVGRAENDLGENRSVVWKSTKAVDVENTYKGMGKTASKASTVMDMYQNTLDTMAANRCQIGKDNYCIGIYGQYNNVRQNTSLASGVYGSIRLPNDKWTIGGTINLANNLDLVKNYETKGTNFPGMALHANYKENKDSTGLNIDLGVAYMKHGLSISREKLSGSESGKGDTKIKGYLGTITVGYGINLQPKTQITPLIGIKHYRVTREAYAENRHADFLASYDSFTNKNTDLQLGLKINQHVSDMITVDAEVGGYANLTNQRDKFGSRMDYFGTRNFESLQTKRYKNYAQLGANLAVTENSIIRADIGWSNTDYKKDATSAGISYSYHF